jgi:hypothetical protein
MKKPGLATFSSISKVKNSFSQKQVEVNSWGYTLKIPTNSFF